MKVYIKNHPTNAGHWIYNKGYFAAWKSMGYEPCLYNTLKEVDLATEYYLMCLDSDITDSFALTVLEKAKTVWLYVQPSFYPGKWGKHPNFITSTNNKIISIVNTFPNLHKWSFLTKNNDLFKSWGEVYSIPLAFDNLGYLSEIKSFHNKYHYEICYIGGRANNGFDEKYQLLQKTFAALGKFKAGFFVERSLTLSDEANILFHSDIGLNVHDVFQREHGFDTNERTFKTLGLTGFIISDDNKQMQDLFGITGTNNLVQLEEMIKTWLQLAENERQKIKEENRNKIIEKHTYIKRVESLLSL